MWNNTPSCHLLSSQVPVRRVVIAALGLGVICTDYKHYFSVEGMFEWVVWQLSIVMKFDSCMLDIFNGLGGALKWILRSFYGVNSTFMPEPSQKIPNKIEHGLFLYQNATKNCNLPLCPKHPRKLKITMMGELFFPLKNATKHCDPPLFSEIYVRQGACHEVWSRF